MLDANLACCSCTVAGHCASTSGRGRVPTVWKLCRSLRVDRPTASGRCAAGGVAEACWMLWMTSCSRAPGTCTDADRCACAGAAGADTGGQNVDRSHQTGTATTRCWRGAFDDVTLGSTCMQMTFRIQDKNSCHTCQSSITAIQFNSKR